MAERWSEALAQVFDRPIRPLGGSGNQKYLRRIVAAKLVFDRLNEVFVAALKSPDIRTRFAQMMAEPVATTPEQFATLIQRELQRYEKVVKASGAQVD